MPGAEANAFPEGKSRAIKRQSNMTAERYTVDGFPSGKRYDTRPSWKVFIWNPQTKEFLGRNAWSWVKILVFYIVFYLFLAGFFTTMMIILYNTLSDDRPKYTAKGGQSILSSPGLTIRPVWYYYPIAYQRSHGDYYIRSIEELIQYYEDTREINIDHYQQCTGNSLSRRVCDFDVSSLTNATRGNRTWGYDTNSPTVILKLNKVFDWEPKVLDKNSDKLPNELRELIRTSTVSMVWVWCTSKKEKDVTFRYSPQPGFPAFYYPFENQPGYLAPLVAVTVNNLPERRLVEVTCTAYAENIKHFTNQFILYLYGG